jgi:hypothetical protein
MTRHEIRKAVEERLTGFAEWAKEAAIWAAFFSTGDYTTSKQYKEAQEFFEKFKDTPGVDYAPVVEYAKTLQEWLASTDKTLDEKADSIIKYLSGGTALVTLAALLSIKFDSPKTNAVIFGLVVLLCLLPSLVCGMVSIYYAISVRIPQRAASLPQIPDAISIAEAYKTKGITELNIWLILNPICEVAYVRNMNKGKWLKWAHRFYLLSIAGLLVPLIGGVVCLICFLARWT